MGASFSLFSLRNTMIITGIGAAIAWAMTVSLLADGSYVMALGAATGGLLSSLATYASNYNMGRVQQATDVMERAAKGELNARALNIDTSGYVGRMLVATNRLLDRVEAFTREAGLTLKAASRGDYYRKIVMTGCVGSFATRAQIINDGVTHMENKTIEFKEMATSVGDSIKSAVSTVSSAATQLEASSENLSAIADDASAQSTTVANAAGEASSNVSSVAAATEEFSASIGEVATQVARSAEAAQQAVNRAKEADQTIQGLSDAAEKISSVVSLITEIAEQTNLLALNATIEAARAGEAGKGFAVVASEVKNLANQTAKATDDIIAQVNNMQSVSNDAVRMIEVVRKNIEDINETAAVITDTTAQQQEAVNEINGSVVHAVTSVSTVADTINNVAEGANSSANGVQEIRSAVAELARTSAQLSGDVDDFINRVVNA
jgi:methyl-accepting chemotaxis protein